MRQVYCPLCGARLIDWEGGGYRGWCPYCEIRYSVELDSEPYVITWKDKK